MTVVRTCLQYCLDQGNGASRTLRVDSISVFIVGVDTFDFRVTFDFFLIFFQNFLILSRFSNLKKV